MDESGCMLSLDFHIYTVIVSREQIKHECRITRKWDRVLNCFFIALIHLT